MTYIKEPSCTSNITEYKSSFLLLPKISPSASVRKGKMSFSCPSKLPSTLLFASLLACLLGASMGGNFFQDFDITWGDQRAKILNGGQLLTLSLDKDSGSGFRSKNEYLFGRIDMQIKLVSGNSAGTVTTYYVSLAPFYSN